MEQQCSHTERCEAKHRRLDLANVVGCRPLRDLEERILMVTAVLVQARDVRCVCVCVYVCMCVVLQSPQLVLFSNGTVNGVIFLSIFACSM